MIGPPTNYSARRCGVCRVARARARSILGSSISGLFYLLTILLIDARDRVGGDFRFAGANICSVILIQAIASWTLLDAHLTVDDKMAWLN